jgi:hypothetical protein
LIHGISAAVAGICSRTAVGYPNFSKKTRELLAASLQQHMRRSFVRFTDTHNAHVMAKAAGPATLGERASAAALLISGFFCSSVTASKPFTQLAD